MLQVSTTSPTHDLTLTIDDEPVRAKIHRFERQEGIAWRRRFVHYGRPRGSWPDLDQETPEQQTAREQFEDECRIFTDQSVTSYVTFAEGDVADDTGAPIVSGADIVRAYENRTDVLSACLQAIFSENFLGKAQKKILSSRRIFSPGSTPSTPTPSGRAPEPTATSAGSSDSAASAPATDDPDANGKALGKVH